MGSLYWLPPHLNSKGYGYWFKAFQPGVDRIISRLEPSCMAPVSGPARTPRG